MEISNKYPNLAAGEANNALLVSLNFPPSSIASVHRARHLANWLPAFGWNSTIICVDERFHKEPPEHALSSLVRPDAEIIKIRALDQGLTGIIGLGDLALRSLPFLRMEIARVVPALNPEVVLITGWPFYQMLLTKWIQDRFQAPVVLDFQDPWGSHDSPSNQFGTKAWLVHRLAMILEPMAIRHASFITSVSDRQNEEMAERYPWLDRTRMAGIPIGGDPSDFAALPKISGQESNPNTDLPVTLSYVGTFMPHSGPLFRSLFNGLAILRNEQPQVASRLKIQCIGTSNQAGDATTLRALPIAEEAGVATFVVEEPARVPFLDALRILSETDAVLMIGSNEPHYTASKIYPGLMSGRPFLSIFHRASSAHSILARAGGGIAIAFETAEELNHLPRQIADGLSRLVTNPQSLGRADSTAYADFTAQAIAGRYADIFDFLLHERRGKRESGIVA